ncbi:MAG: tyrosine--tRNA ligase [Candidatus Rokuibacteriota bacterium]|nr:MAG: tyrosine--tRNA ligase [Candidatus Rokubacteria bacterium]
MRPSLLDDFEARGLIADVTHRDELAQHFAAGPRSVYCGFDPTADSLHIGSLLPLLALRRIQQAGHRPIVLIGGGTGLIGDPSGKAGERPLSEKLQVTAWAERLKTQVSRFLEFGTGPTGAQLLDNYAWLGELNVLGFLRDIGKEFSIGTMIARESVRARMGRADAGLSYTEFSYQILQAYDFLRLFQDHGCSIQIGGSDQWGNITAGIDLIRRKTGEAAYGLTLPLVTKADGAKFGKTESGTVWLDPARTSPYAIYQFWLNTADDDVITYLKYFTFLPIARIDDLAAASKQAPEKREAQEVLAEEVTRLVHGEAAVREAREITSRLFKGEVKLLTLTQAAQACSAMNRMTLTPADMPFAVVDLLTGAGLAESKKRARELIVAGAVQVNGKPVKDPSETVSQTTALFDTYFIVRKGKKTYAAATLGER